MFTQINSTTWTETQALNRPAPTDPLDGVPVAGLDALFLVVEAVTGTIDGGSFMFCYLYDPAIGSWIPFLNGDSEVPDAGMTKYINLVSAINWIRPGMRLCWVPYNTFAMTAGDHVKITVLGATIRGV